MAETRKKLSEKQLTQLQTAEKDFGEKTAIAQSSKSHLDAIVELIFDAHGVVPGPDVSFDPRSGELVVTTTE
jgi:hypothetical protein